MMNKPGFYILLLFSLVAVCWLGGCRGHRNYDNNLTAADAMMRQDVDSALATLSAIQPAGLAHDADRAYHALLLTEARYRCYIPATSDSLINVALDYYERHSEEREKLTRAYIYKGAVMEELGQHREAMQYYKTALSQAASDDYFNQGYIRLRIGNIYRDNLVADSADITMFKEALNYFKQVPDSFYIAVCLNEIGTSYFKNNKVQVMPYLERGLAMARLINATGLESENLRTTAEFQMFSNNPQEIESAKQIAFSLIKNEAQLDDVDGLFMIVVFTLAKQNKTDSATYYLNKVAIDQMSPGSRVLYNRCLGEIARSKGDVMLYQHFYEYSDEIADSIVQNAVQVQLRDTEAEYDNEALKNENLRYKMRLMTSILITALALSLLTIVVMAYHRKLSRRKQQLKDKEDAIERLHSEQAQLSLQLENDKVMNDNLKEAIQNQIEMFARLVEKHRKEFTTDPKEFAKLFEAVYSVSQPDSAFWLGLRAYADSVTDNLVSRTVQAYPELLDTDVQVLSLCCSNLPTTVIMACMGYNDAHSVYNKKRRIAETMGLEDKLDEYIQRRGK